MLSIGLFLLVCSLTSAVFGFSPYAPSGWTWEKCSFLISFLLAAMTYLNGTMSPPADLRDFLDEVST